MDPSAHGQKYLADDNTPYACDANLTTLMSNIEDDTLSALVWFEVNYMKLNEKKSSYFGQNARIIVCSSW